MEDLLRQVWVLYNDMAIYLLFGLGLAGLLHVAFPASFIYRHLGTGSLSSVLKAAAFGVPLPLCSCGVLPTAISLNRRGASRGATVSFLVSTPQTGVDSLLITLAMLGPAFMIARPIAALATGVVAGLAVNTFSPAGCPAAPEPASAPSSRLRAGLHHAFVELLDDISVWLVVGLLAAAVITLAVPDDFFRERIGSGVGAMALMMIAGIPLYVCATGSVPIAAALVMKGLSPGAAFVFLMTGPATNAASIILIARRLGAKVAAVYLASIAAGAIAFGLMLNAAYGAFSLGRIGPSQGHEMLPAWIARASAVVFALLLLGSFARKLTAAMPSKKAAPPNGPSRTFAIEGMTCRNCAGAVESAVGGLSGIQGVQVEIEPGRATVTGDADEEAIVAAIREAGFLARRSEEEPLDPAPSG